jgi:hypothetical protein
VDPKTVSMAQAKEATWLLAAQTAQIQDLMEAGKWEEARKLLINAYDSASQALMHTSRVTWKHGFPLSFTPDKENP